MYIYIILDVEKCQEQRHLGFSVKGHRDCYEGGVRSFDFYVRLLQAKNLLILNGYTLYDNPYPRQGKKFSPENF